MEESILEFVKVHHCGISEDIHKYDFGFPEEWEAILENQDILLVGIWVYGLSTSWPGSKFRFLYRNVDIELYNNTHTVFWGGECENILDKFQLPVTVAKVDNYCNYDDDGAYVISDHNPTNVTITIRWMPVPSTPTSTWVDFSMEGGALRSAVSNKIYLSSYRENSTEQLIEHNMYLQFNKQDERVPAERIEVIFGENHSVGEMYVVSPTTLCLVKLTGDLYVGCMDDAVEYNNNRGTTSLIEDVSCTYIKTFVYVYNF